MNHRGGSKQPLVKRGSILKGGRFLPFTSKSVSPPLDNRRRLLHRNNIGGTCGLFGPLVSSLWSPTSFGGCVRGCRSLFASSSGTVQTCMRAVGCALVKSALRRMRCLLAANLPFFAPWAAVHRAVHAGLEAQASSHFGANLLPLDVPAASAERGVCTCGLGVDSRLGRKGTAERGDVRGSTVARSLGRLALLALSRVRNSLACLRTGARSSSCDARLPAGPRDHLRAPSGEFAAPAPAPQAPNGGTANFSNDLPQAILNHFIQVQRPAAIPQASSLRHGLVLLLKVKHVAAPLSRQTPPGTTTAAATAAAAWGGRRCARLDARSSADRLSCLRCQSNGNALRGRIGHRRRSWGRGREHRHKRMRDVFCGVRRVRLVSGSEDDGGIRRGLRGCSSSFRLPLLRW
mmetsp:Transcript_150353/g.483195  ORF Transcript_150353/g.483195 Transcript_150353/m.483195 type:complete len:404 (-) Transcript_150353:999-2210(-)